MSIFLMMISGLSPFEFLVRMGCNGIMLPLDVLRNIKTNAGLIC